MLAYDANGNTLSDAQGRSFTWDFENRLTQAVVPGANGGTTTFKYDPFGRRIYKQSPSFTSVFVYDTDNLLETLNASGSEVASYTQTQNIDEVVAELRGSSTDYYEVDGLGSTTSLSSSSGTLANTYTYDSFGNPTASTGTVRNYFEYSGREFDPETGIYEYRARYFDPTVGRFISEDPLRFRAGMNFFAYVHNNPVVLDDPMGLCDKNCQLSISCGPTPRTQGFSHCSVTIQNGTTYTQYDAGASDSIWWSQLRFAPPGPGVAPGPDSFVKNVPVPCDCAQKAANDINSGNMVYSFPFQNSNTAAAMMAEDCGVYTLFPPGAWGAPMPSGPPTKIGQWPK